MLELTLLVVFPALMAYAAASDLLTMTIPNMLSLALVVAFAGLALAVGLMPGAFLMNVAAGLLVLAVTFGLFAFGWIGGGDAKLAAATALWLGFEVLPAYLFVASLGGGALTLGVLFLRRWPLPAFATRLPWLMRIHDPQSGVPYGIALAFAALAVYPHSSLWVAALAR